MTDNYLAIDLGAESGRTILGTLVDEKLILAETHRFPNGLVRLPDGLHSELIRNRFLFTFDTDIIDKFDC